MRIIVEGLIGVGKSTFTTEASQLFKLKPMYESVEDNPFLEKFYNDDPKRWAYTLQMHFLYDRFAKHLPDHTISDRSIYGDIGFANILHADGVLSDEEHASYMKHFKTLTPFLPHVDLCIHLHVSVDQAMERISKRGREFEAQIPKSYLEKLQAEIELIPNHLPSSTRYIRLDWGDMDSQERQEVISRLL